MHKANLLPVGSPVVINEIGLAGPRGPLDEAGNPADWIELYNKSGRTVSLKDCALTDSLARTRKWTFRISRWRPGAICWSGRTASRG